MEKLKLYTVTKPSSDGTFVLETLSGFLRMEI